MLIPLDIPPGVFANGQAFEVGQAGRWYRSNLVRWQDGLLKPIGGWVGLGTTPALSGVARSMLAWRNNSNQRELAISTHTHLYVRGDSETVVDITPLYYLEGRVDSIYGAGYGFGPYGAEEYGTVRTSVSNILDATVWSLDTWGENLIAVANHEGIIYDWSPGDAAAVQVSNAPTGVYSAFVTAERHLVALSGRTVSWSDREDNTDWTPVATNQAGDFNLQTRGQLRCGLRVRGSSLLLTTQDAHTMTFLGSPLVFSFQVAGQGCGVYGPKAAVASDSIAAWMGPGGFYYFDGTVRSLPSDVHDYVYSDINNDQGAKIHAALLEEFSEIWWFYPSANSSEIDRYVIWNYQEGHWAIGELERTAWASAGVYRKPIAIDADASLYQHETGWTADGVALNGTRYAESGAVSIETGDQVATVRQMVPDERTSGQTRVSFKTRLFPNGAETVYGPYTLSELTDMRFQSRQVSVKIEGVADADWRIGLPRFDIVPGGRR